MPAMRQTFDESTDPSFGPRHVPLIREAMARQGLDALVVPHEDEHQNEYLPEANDRLAWATGFTGSAGAAVIFKDKAAIFVDGRYSLQVRDQVDTNLFEVRDLVDGGVVDGISTLDNALLTGDIQVITTVQTPQALAQFGDTSKYTVINGTTNGKVMMTLNDARPPLNDVRVRQAINYALDKEAIVKAAWAGYGTPIGSHEVPTDPWYVDLADRYPHDVAKAKELLQEAGQTNLTLRLALPPVPYAAAAAPIIVSQLAEAGIRVQTSDVTFDNWLGKIFAAPYDYDMTIINHVEQYDVTTVFSGKPDYYTQYTNPDVTQLEAEGLAGDHDTFIADFRKVMTTLADDAAAAWLWAYPNLMVADADVRGLPENAIGESLNVAGLYTD